jgi:hypothetical protein
MLADQLEACGTDESTGRRRSDRPARSERASQSPGGVVGCGGREGERRREHRIELERFSHGPAPLSDLLGQNLLVGMQAMSPGFWNRDVHLGSL